MDKLKDQLKKNKIIIIVLIIALIAFWLFSGSEKEIEPLISVLDKSPMMQQTIGSELIIELQRLKALSQLNGNFFQNTSFVSLKDISVVISPRPIGRSNPFIQ